MNDPLAPLEVVATNAMFCDPCIDQSDPDDAEQPSAADRLAKYRKTRELSDLVMRSDPKPTVFVCKLVSPSAAAHMLDVASTPRLYAFAIGCHEIRLPSGQVMRPGKMKTLPGGTSAPVDEDDWTNKVARKFGLDTVYEIGSVIHDRARLPEDAKGLFTFRAG